MNPPSAPMRSTPHPWTPEPVLTPLPKARRHRASPYRLPSTCGTRRQTPRRHRSRRSTVHDRTGRGAHPRHPIPNRYGSDFLDVHGVDTRGQRRRGGDSHRSVRSRLHRATEVTVGIRWRSDSDPRQPLVSGAAGRVRSHHYPPGHQRDLRLRDGTRRHHDRPLRRPPREGRHNETLRPANGQRPQRATRRGRRPRTPRSAPGRTYESSTPDPTPRSSTPRSPSGTPHTPPPARSEQPPQPGSTPKTPKPHSPQPPPSTDATTSTRGPTTRRLQHHPGCHVAMGERVF